MRLDPFSLAKGNRSRYFSIGPWKCFLDARAGFTRRISSKDKNPIKKNEDSVLTSAGFTLPRYKVSQVHGKSVFVVKKKNGASHVEADALVTSHRNMPLVLYYADCVPVYFFDPSTWSVGVAHAGWRGTAAGVCREVVRTMMKTYGTNPRHLLAVIGPSIKHCCYDVREDVFSVFKKTLPEKMFKKIFKKKTHTQWWCNLAAANKEILLSERLNEKNILVSARCTSCEAENFYSYRRDHGKTGRMMAFIGLL